MDIKQIRYFIAIVENHFNLSQAAELLYVSQPTLSMMINDFEKRENVKLFKRKRGRIIGLTYLGDNYYKDAQKVLSLYDDMFLKLHDHSKVKGKYQYWYSSSYFISCFLRSNAKTDFRKSGDSIQC